MDQDSAKLTIEISSEAKKRFGLVGNLRGLIPRELFDQMLAEYINRHKTELEVGLRGAYSLLGLQPQHRDRTEEGDLRDLRLSGRTYNALARGGAGSIADLAGATEAELRALPGIGNQSLLEVKVGLSEFGLQLSDENTREVRPKWLDDRDEKLREERRLRVGGDHY